MIQLSGYKESFHIEDRHLTNINWTLDQYIKWLRGTFPHIEPSYDA